MVSKSGSLKETFRLSLYAFSRETTLHGIKRIALANGLWKKLLWSILMIMSFVVLFIQLTNKLNSYLKPPVALDIDVRYFNFLTFPAVILCNANLFRISEVTKTKWNMYDVLVHLYNETVSAKIDGKRFPQLKVVDGSQFFVAAAHQKEKMILHCLWPDGERCTSADFKTVITDYGVCYSINDENRRSANSSKPFLITNTGSSYGLYLVLNVEDYEVMAGPQKTVGVKVLIYEQNTIPAVSEHGFDAAPGFHTSVGLKYTRTEKLGYDRGGQCGKAPLKIFKNETYTRRVCALDHKYWSALNQCSCLPYNVPSYESAYPLCTAEQYFTCLVRAMQKPQRTRDEKCPQDCVSNEFQQYVSFSELSTINVNNILTANQRKDMEDSYLTARVSALIPYL